LFFLNPKHAVWHKIQQQQIQCITVENSSIFTFLRKNPNIKAVGTFNWTPTTHVTVLFFSRRAKDFFLLVTEWLQALASPKFFQ